MSDIYAFDSSFDTVMTFLHGQVATGATLVNAAQN